MAYAGIKIGMSYTTIMLPKLVSSNQMTDAVEHKISLDILSDHEICSIPVSAQILV